MKEFKRTHARASLRTCVKSKNAPPGFQVIRETHVFSVAAGLRRIHIFDSHARSSIWVYANPRCCIRAPTNARAGHWILARRGRWLRYSFRDPRVRMCHRGRKHN